MPRHRFTVLFLAIALAAGGAGSACKKKSPPIARPTPPPPDTDMTANRPPAPPEPVTEAPPVAVPPEPSVSSADMGSLDEINKKGILAPVFFEFDSAEMSSDGQSVLAKNAEMMKQFDLDRLVEGHCDERGTAEYSTWRSASARCPYGSTWCRAAAPRRGSAPSATARSSPAIPATASRRGRTTAAPTSSSPPSKGRQI
jgi:hypothetical protein